MATQADLDRLEAARIALGAGEQVQRVRYSGPPEREIVYHPTDLDKLERLIAVVRAELSRASGRARLTYIATKDGF